MPPVKIPVLSEVQIRAEKIRKEETKRLKEVADKVTEILIKENVSVNEVARVTDYVIKNINEKVSSSSVKYVLGNLEKKE